MRKQTNPTIPALSIYFSLDRCPGARKSSSRDPTPLGSARKKIKKSKDLLDAKARRFLASKTWCLWSHWGFLCGEMCAASCSCIPGVPDFHLICSWSEVPLDRDGLTGEGPGWCTEVSGMSRVGWLVELVDCSVN